MFTRILTGLMTLTFALSLAACNGPTQAGKDARMQANQRMNLMGAQIHFDQARQAFATGQFEKAEREIARAIDRHAESAEYYVLLGRINLETHRLEEASSAFSTAIEKQSDGAVGAEANYYAGIVFQRWSDDSRAQQHYARAFELEPSNVQYLLASAESLIALGQLEAAKAVIDSKLNYFEHNAALRQLQGQIALLQNDPKRAAGLYADARMLNPDDEMLLEELMWAQYAAGMYGQCHESVKSMQQGSENPRPELMRLEARCLTMMSRGPEARALYLELTRLQPSDPLIWCELGGLAWDLGDYRSVAQASVQVIALAPDRYEGYMLKGINERHKGNLSEAATLFRQSAERGSDLALPHLLLGQTLEQSGDVAGATAAYRQAVAAEPENREAALLLSRLIEGDRVTSAPTEIE